MTRTIQPLSRTVVENMERPGKTEAEDVTCDILAVCDSLNRLCEVLNKLDYVIKRKECLG